LNPKKQVVVGETLELKALATKADGTPVTTPQPVTFQVGDQSILDFVDTPPEGSVSVTKETGTDGSVALQVMAVNSGKTKVTATIIAEGEQTQQVTTHIEVEVPPRT
jgi:hypothetical protein